MSSHFFFQVPSTTTAILLLAFCCCLLAAVVAKRRLRAQVETLKFSELVQKANAADIEAKYKALLVENQRVCQQLKAANDALVPVQEQNELRRFAIQMFSLFFNTLQLSQEIMEKLFPNDPTVRASSHGSTIRKMFEFVTHLLLPSNFFDSGDSIDIKLHTGIGQFIEFSIAFAKFIYASNMELPGGDFIVCGMDNPIKEQSKYSMDGSRVYEAVIFVVYFYCRNTRKKYKIVFSCDHGRTYPKEDFDVNSLTFDAIRGFSSLVNGSPVPVLQIIMGIMNRRAKWNRLPDAPFSGILRVLELRNKYVLYACPFVTRTDFCSFSLEPSKYALDFSGCRCGIDRSFSISMLCEFLVSNPNTPLRCPYCKEILPNLTHENFDPTSVAFDLSCIEDSNFLEPGELKRLQEEGRSFPRIFGFDKSSPSELDEITGKLLSSEKVCHHRSHLPNLPELLDDENLLFFHSIPGEDSDPEPEPESDDDQGDQG